MAKFAYNNAKNISIGYTLFKFNCRYYLCVFYKENLNLYSKLRIMKEFFSKF